MNPLPEIKQIQGHPRFFVDGKPFLSLGLQWDCDSCFSTEVMNPLFPHAARLCANTVSLPVYWKEVEPTPGKYVFEMVDERIRQARMNGLRLVLLWFATWKNATAFYAPDYIKSDSNLYSLALTREGGKTISPCPSGKEIWQRDRDALIALMSHLRDHDEQRTVIMVQVENEPGLLSTDRCYCPVCTAQFQAGGWEREWGVHAAEAFSAAMVAGYIDRLAVEAKRVYPIPLYTNVWLSHKVGGIPGKSYPSGGAVPEMLTVFRAYAPHLDLIAPDIYTSGYRDFQRVCQVYSSSGNPLYIAEASSSVNGRAERNAFYAFGEHHAIGFDPWAIDWSYPDQYDHPIVDRTDGRWGPQAYTLRDSYFAIARAMQPIITTQGTPQLFTFVQEPQENGTGWAADGCDVLISYQDPDQAARGMVIQVKRGEFLLVGVGFEARFQFPRPFGGAIPNLWAEAGYFKGDQWVCQRVLRIERPESHGIVVKMIEPDVIRVTF